MITLMVKVATALGVAIGFTGLFAACTFDTAGPSRLHGDAAGDSGWATLFDGAVDGLGVDSARDGVVVDTRRDGGGHDTLAPDATLDTRSSDTTADTLSPDTTVDTIAPIPDAYIAACATAYSGAASYELCSADSTTCTFAFSGDGSDDCEDFCSGNCVAGHNNVDGTSCEIMAEPACGPFEDPEACTCNTNLATGICICSR